MPEFTQVNWLAVVIATAASIVIGYIWYLPAVFGRQWAEATGRELRSPASYGATTWIVGLVVALVAAYVLALFAGGTGLVDGAVIGAVLWLGFVATALVTAVLFEDRTWSYFAITGGYYLVSAIVMGGIVGYFPATM